MVWANKKVNAVDWFIIGVTALIILVDIIIVLFTDYETISRRIYTYSFEYPIIPFGFGVLMGHFFWSMDPKPEVS